MMFRAACLTAKHRPLRRASALRPWLARLLLIGLAACACTKEAPREPPPRAEEPEAAPAPNTTEPAPPPPAAPEPSRQDESGGGMDFGLGEAAPVKPAAPAAAPAAKKSRPPAAARAATPRKAAPSAGTEIDLDKPKDDGASPEALRRELSKAVDLSTPDCPSARERKQAICDLASQLCQLVDRDPDVASVEAYCAEARQRCNEAERRTAERCPR